MAVIPPEAVLEASKIYIGSDRQKDCEQIIKKLQVFLQTRRQIQHAAPYRGLFAFREEDERFFFGRDVYIEKLRETVRTQALIAIIGASGSGKSSLVYAGLIPELRRQGNWLITSFRPGGSPFKAVATSLISFLYTDELERLSQSQKLAMQLKSSEISLIDVITRIIEKNRQAKKFLLFADQFEELYSLCYDNDERRHFLDEFLQICEFSIAYRFQIPYKFP